jgi:acetyltransferase-like isoleucine patch superfamily enzyme
MKTETVDIQRDISAADSSPLQKYAQLVVGKPGLGALLKHECITALSGLGGAAGLWLRSKLYRSLLGSCGRGVVIGRYVTLRHPHKIHLGDGVVIDDLCLLDAKGDDNKGIHIGAGAFVGRNSILSCKNGDIDLGERVNIGFNCEIVSASRVQVGADSLLAAYSYIVGADHNYADPTTPILEQGRISRGVSMGEDVWLGAGVIVNDGVQIESHAIVGAGAVVTADIPAYSICTGVPARVKRDRRTPPPAS